MNEQMRDFIYTQWGDRGGWLSKVSGLFDLSSEDVSWMIWRDNQEQAVHDQLSEWDAEIEREGGLEIYNEPDLGRKLVLVNSRIDALEKQAEAIASPESRMFFLEFSALDQLNGLRYRIRNQIMALEVPDRVVLITDQEIERARTIRLDRLIPGLPKSRKIKCPFHQENTPSFHVGKWGFCFGCGAHEDAISWVMRNQSISFLDAVKRLGGLGN